VERGWTSWSPDPILPGRGGAAWRDVSRCSRPVDADHRGIPASGLDAARRRRPADLSRRPVDGRV